MRNFFGIPNRVQPPTQMRMRGIEPLTENSQSIVNTALSENNKNHFDTNFDSILKKHPEIARLILAWPTLPKHYREAIISTVEKQSDKGTMDE